MRSVNIILLAAACCLAMCLPALAGIVVLDVATKTATSDTDALEPVGVQTKGTHCGVYIQNVTEQPQELTLQVTGLEDGTYDVYINRTALQAEDEAELLKASGGMGRVYTDPGQLIAENTRARLEEGISLSIPGGLGEQDHLRCLKAARPRIDAEYQRLQMYQSGDYKRVWHTMAQAADWIRSAVSKDDAYRSASVIVVPSGETPARMSWRTRLDAEDTLLSMVRACQLLHMARARMSQVISEQALRTSAVRALTPVDFSAVYTVIDGAPSLRATVTNNCNIPVKGSIVVDVPEGWNAAPAKIEFDNVGSGKSHTIEFDLQPVKAAASLPDSLAAAANIIIAQTLDPREHFGSDPNVRPYATEFGPREYKAELSLRIVAPKQ